MSHLVKEILVADFNEEVLNSDLPVVVYFWASWCEPCITAAPIFEELAGKFIGKAKFVKVNFDSEKTLVERYGIDGIPVFLFFKNYRVYRSEGFGEASPKTWESVLNQIVK